MNLNIVRIDASVEKPLAYGFERPDNAKNGAFLREGLTPGMPVCTQL